MSGATVLPGERRGLLATLPELPPGADPAALLPQARPLDTGLSADYLEHHGVLPLGQREGRLVVATWRDAVDPQTLDDLSEIVGAPVEVVTIGESDLRAAIRRLYTGESARDVIADLGDDGRAGEAGEGALDDLVSLANEAPVVKLVNLLLLEALEARASDVHLETYAGSVRVRYRIDGVLQDAAAPPARLAAAVVSRLKIMAELDIAERRIPQDGRIRLRLRDRPVDVRVSTLPTLHGESVVLRLLDKQSGRIGLHEMGMPDDVLRAFVAAVSRPHGIVLTTGPTGSGKTTTLYAAVDRIHTGREKILTVEDPVEYELPGVPQVSVNTKVGLTFASALRALLRQDPDVMLVGEIRDHETAEIATHAALTGHLVLSTLHTNDAPSAITRLVDLGIEPYLVASTVEAILAQRLVRKICNECKEPAELTVEERTALGIPLDEPFPVWAGKGCSACRGTGYVGRTGIYELLVMNDEMRSALHKDVDASRLGKIALANGMRRLRDDGVRLIRAGVTTPEEVLRVAVG